MIFAAAKKNTKAKDLAIYGLSTAMVFVATGFVNIRLPIMAQGGLIHFGNVPLFLTAFLFGKKAASFSGAFGMALFDLFSGWAAWAPFTFIITGLMGYAAGAIAQRGNKNFKFYVLAILAALIIKIAGYYIAEAILYGNWIAPAASIMGNIFQVVIAGLIVLSVSGRLAQALDLKGADKNV